MRTNMFGEYIIDSEDDSLGDYLGLCETDPADVYAQVYTPTVTDQKWSFEVLTKEDGKEIIKSAEMFDNEEALRKYLTQWLDNDDIELVA